MGQQKLLRVSAGQLSASPEFPGLTLREKNIDPYKTPGKNKMLTQEKELTNIPGYHQWQIWNAWSIFLFCNGGGKFNFITSFAINCSSFGISNDKDKHIIKFNSERH